MRCSSYLPVATVQTLGNANNRQVPLRNVRRKKMPYPVTQYTGFTKAFFTFRMSYCYTVRVSVLAFMPVQELRSSVGRFSQNLQMLGKRLWKSPVPLFTEIGGKCRTHS